MGVFLLTSLNFDAVKQELLKLKGKEYPLLSGKGDHFVLKDLDESGIRTASVGKKGSHKHPLEDLTDFLSALNTGKFVTNNLVLKDTGSVRSRVMALLACHPEIYWAIEGGKKGRIGLVWRPQQPHSFGEQVKLTDEEEVAKLVKWDGILSQPHTQTKTLASLPVTFNLTDFDSIKKAIAGAGLLFDEKDLYTYHANLTCLPRKHFVILSGVSGTGKSELARAYANAVYGQDPWATNQPYFLRAEVEADWQSMRPLLGYYNHLNERYERKPFLEILIQAVAEYKRSKAEGDAPRPFFVCLDEMNIARVEYYFSRLLSAMESGDPIHLHHGERGTDGVPEASVYPPNLFLTATINTDESTFAVSDKVLDRAFTMDLSTVHMDAYATLLKSKAEYAGQEALIDKLFAQLKPLQEALAPKRFHMGYRALKEITAFVVASQQVPGILTQEQALDRVLAAKGLAKLRGDDRLIGTLDLLIPALEKLTGATYCLTRIKEMKDEIGAYGLSQFGR